MVELNDKDLRILEILQNDARTPFSTLARELGMAESTVRYRVDRLRESGVITGFLAMLDPRKIGLNITAIALIKVDANHIVEASEILASFEESHHLFRSTGSYDLVSVVHARDIAHLDGLIDRIRRILGVKEASVEVATYLVKVEPKYKLLK
ncbi:MAG: Lrp/AsnC family transcriptional regulator [Candidatus Bathyarchaeota archaeon]|nr:MAG: Lrp/AsnC family transcriptional regulator [Candidatus Bathyarchaeota archaeon]